MRQKIFRKENFPFLLLIPMFLFLGILWISGKDRRDYQALCKQILKEELQENTLNLHYTFVVPKNYGLSDYTVCLPLYSEAQTKASDDLRREYVSRLKKIHPEKLPEKERASYALLEQYLTLGVQGEAYLYYDEPLSPSSGMQSQLPILLAEYTFRTPRDVEDYLGLLACTGEYFASLLQFEKEKKEAGLLQPDSSLQKIRTQCETILSEEELRCGTHFLQTTFAERLSVLVQNRQITREQAQKYMEENNRLLLEVMVPAYENLSDGLLLLMNGNKELPTGLCHKEKGQAYYEWLLLRMTGSDRSASEIKALLYARFDRSYRQLNHALTAKYEAPLLWQNALMQDFPLEAPDEMLLDLQERMAADFPEIPGGNAGFTIKEVSESLSPYTAPAFYLTPPLDDSDTNVIYINNQTEKSGLELYTTLAHEGYPGHLYQSVLTNRLFLANEENPVRALLSYPGFLEGYALYVENISYDYAADLAREYGSDDLAYGYYVEKCSRDLQLCLLAFLDISIHYDGAGLEDVQKVLASLGITDPETAENVYTYIAEEPGNYLKYYLGYLEIEALKDEAKALWGKEYSDLAFHTFLLQAGPADFPYLHALLAGEN